MASIRAMRSVTSDMRASMKASRSRTTLRAASLMPGSAFDFTNMLCAAVTAYICGIMRWACMSMAQGHRRGFSPLFIWTFIRSSRLFGIVGQSEATLQGEDLQAEAVGDEHTRVGA